MLSIDIQPIENLLFRWSIIFSGRVMKLFMLICAAIISISTLTGCNSVPYSSYHDEMVKDGMPANAPVMH